MNPEVGNEALPPSLTPSAGSGQALPVKGGGDSPATVPLSLTGGGKVRWTGFREWLKLVDGIEELRVIRGANSETDIGAVTEMLDHTEGSPCVLFDGIPGFQDGFRVAVNTQGTIPRQ